MDQTKASADLGPVLSTFWERARKAQERGSDLEARAWLEGIVELDARNVSAWLALAKLIPDTQERMYCYAQVLELSPGNQEAKEGLRKTRRGL